jgi:hypothetical protein
MERGAFAKSFLFARDTLEFSWIPLSCRTATLIYRSASLSVAEDPCLEEIKLGFSGDRDATPQISSKCAGIG